MDPTSSSVFARVLSPMFSKNDKSFLFSINTFIEDELNSLQTVDQDQFYFGKEKFLIYKQAFSKVYRALLSRIKREYEYCIGDMEKSQTDFINSTGEIIKIQGSEKTLENLKNRKKELITILEDFENENSRLVNNLNEILKENVKYQSNKAENSLNSNEVLSKDQFAFLKVKGQLVNENRSKGPIKGLSLEKSTDLNYLIDLLNEFEGKIIDIRKSQEKNYATKKQKLDIEKELFKKMSERDKVHEETANIKNNMLVYKYAINISKEYYKGNTKFNSIQDALLKGVAEIFLHKINLKTDEDDYSRGLNLENDAENILEYLENFNELFDSEKYMQAAYYAAASPKNILRNIDTLYKFKKVTNDNDYKTDENDPLFVYCISVIDSINEDSLKPNVDMSIECIKIILKYNKIDFLTRLTAQRRITFSYKAAKLIEDHAFLKPKNSKNLFEIALFIYKDIKAYFEVAVCMARLDRFSAMLDFINDELASKTPEIYFNILEQCPSIELACDIMDNSKVKSHKIPIDKIVSILLDSDRPENGLKFLKIQIQKNSKIKNNESNLKKLKASYETLVKFSFLTCEDEEFTKSVAQESRDQLNNILINKYSTDTMLNKSTENAFNDKVHKLQLRRNSLKETRRSDHQSIAEDKEPEEEKKPNNFKLEIANDRRSSVTSNLRSNVHIGTLIEKDEDKK